MIMEFAHKSVLLEETIDNLNIKPDGIYVDGTLGGAGHSEQIVKRLGEGGRLIGIDQDEDAIAAASKRLEPYGDKVTIVRDNYQNFTGYSLIWECLHINSIMRIEDSHIGLMLHWI